MNISEVADILDEISTYLQFKNENPFKIRAFSNASRIMQSKQGNLNDLLESGDLKNTKGIGKGILEKLEEIKENGKSLYLEELHRNTPEGLKVLLNVPGLGPKKAKALYDELKIETLEDLETAAREGKIEPIKGFSKKTVDNILKGIEFIRKFSDRNFYHKALQSAQDYQSFLISNAPIHEISIAGSLRRHMETVKDIDFVASSEDPHQVMELFIQYPEVDQVTAQGDTKSAVVLHNGIRVDLRVVTIEEYPYALHHFTGSKEHNTAMRSRAKTLGMKMNEYGLFQGETNIPCKDEEAIFKTLKLHYIPPELRENQGEIEKAENQDFHDLVTYEDIQGVLHLHSTYSDGKNSIEEMTRAAIDCNFQYIGFTDHSQTAFYANGLKADRIEKQREEIQKVQEKYPGIRLLHGIESDILKNGDLDYPDSILEKFDFIVASVHGNFNQSESKMTERVSQALKNPYTTMLGHPTGRLLLSREGYPIDMMKIIEVAVENQKIIEINANPHRFDMDWRVGLHAQKLNLITSINPDAHSIQGLQHMRLGIGIARKAGFSKDQVLNTWSREKIEDYLNHAS